MLPGGHKETLELGRAVSGQKDASHGPGGLSRPPFSLSSPAQEEADAPGLRPLCSQSRPLKCFSEHLQASQ